MHFSVMELKRIKKGCSDVLFTALSNLTHQFAFRAFVTNYIHLFNANQPLFRALETAVLNMPRKAPFKDLLAKFNSSSMKS
jgi:hypothetical protein